MGPDSSGLQSESLGEVQFVINSCRLVTQPHYLNNSNKIVIGLF